MRILFLMCISDNTLSAHVILYHEYIEDTNNVQYPEILYFNCSVNVFNYQYSNMGVQQLHILYSHSASMVSRIQYHGGTTLWSCSIVTWMYPFRTTGLKFCAPKKRPSAVTAVSCLLLCKRRQNDQRSSFIAFFIKVIVFYQEIKCNFNINK